MACGTRSTLDSKAETSNLTLCSELGVQRVPQLGVGYGPIGADLCARPVHQHLRSKANPE